MQVHVSWIDSGTAVFSLRGTESTQDGLQDLKLIRRNIDFLARACPGAKAHTGTSHLLVKGYTYLKIFSSLSASSTATGAHRAALSDLVAGLGLFGVWIAA